MNINESPLSGLWKPRTWWDNVRHPHRTLTAIAGDGSVYALLILFGLNAVDELDRTAFAILIPTIRDHFGMSDTGILSLITLTALGAILLQLPIATLADRTNRVRLAMIGAVAMAAFSFSTGLASTVWMLCIVRAGSGIGQATVDPTHNSLLSDYFPVDRRAAVFSFHRGANALGMIVGPLSAGVLAHYFGWRTPFLVFAVPTLILVALASKLKEPVRGAREREAMGASADSIATEEAAPSYAEAWRLVWKIESLRRIWYAIPFLAVSIIGFVALAALIYDRVYGYNELQRGVLAAFVQIFQFLGLIIGGRVGTRRLLKDPASVFGFLRTVAFAASVFVLLFAVAPNIYVAVVAHAAVTGCLAILLPALFGALSLAIPARARAMGFAVASYWIIPGLALIPFIGWVGDRVGIRWGVAIMSPVLMIGAVMVGNAGRNIKRDIDDVWTTSAARSQALFLRRQGKAKLLLLRDLNVSYGPVQVLFDITADIGEGEVVALLGTNGAGKSTLLKAISGVVEAEFGAVIFDGRDITHAPPNEIACLGIAQMPGGRGVFPTLTVRENLRVAGWQRRRHRGEIDADLASMLTTFKVLAERIDEPAANLSGGQQQMLALAMSLLTRPQLLMIDELSLGLAPVVVEQLADLVRTVAAGGTTIIIVEQSVNVALTLAERAIFMEKGQIRFTGPTSELLDRPDILRSVFLGGLIEEELSSSEPSASVGGVAVVNGSPPLLDTTPPGHPVFPVVERAVVLETRGVCCSFGGIRAVNDVSVSVSSQEIVGIIGPNGAGKTTWFDIISGFVPATLGQVLIAGRNVTDQSAASRARIGLGRSFQDARLFSSMTVSEAVAVAYDRWVDVKDPINPILRLPASIDSEAAVRRRVSELLELFGLAEYRNSFIGELSTGTRRIVDLAGVVAHSPTVLLLDEPSSGIAQREAEALGPLIVRLRDELGCAIVVIEHDMVLLKSISDRMVALDAGSVICDGSPDDVLNHPVVVSSYLGNTAELIERSGAR